MSDPTYDEMKETLYSLSIPFGADDCDVEEAIYAFASDYHGGQWSNLYEAICLSEFVPGAAWDGVDEEGEAFSLYAELEERFGTQ